MNYSPVIYFEISLFNTYEAKALIKSNQTGKSNTDQQKRCRYGSINRLCITSMDYPLGLSIRKAETFPWG